MKYIYEMLYRKDILLLIHIIICIGIIFALIKIVKLYWNTEIGGDKMIGILLLTHEDFGAGMIKSAELIVGNVQHTLSLGLHRGDDIATFKLKVQTAIMELDEGGGVLVFVDLFGASPYNATAMASQNIKPKFRCITGLSFPMLLEALTMRGNYELVELTTHCMQVGVDGVKELFSEMGLL